MKPLQDLSPGEFRREGRCPVCKIPQRVCVCDSMPTIELPYRFYILRHGKEVNKQSNTGSLVPEMLPGSRLLEWGQLDEPLDRSVFAVDDAVFMNIYPLAAAPRLSPQVLHDTHGKILTFVLLDATWSKSRRMLHRIHEIQQFPFYSLPEGSQPDRVLRRAPSEDRYSTLDAVIRAVEVLGDIEEAARMRAFMDVLYQHILAARGRRSGSTRPRSD